MIAARGASTFEDAPDDFRTATQPAEPRYLPGRNRLDEVQPGPRDLTRHCGENAVAFKIGTALFESFTGDHKRRYSGFHVRGAEPVTNAPRSSLTGAN
jgi:hypothetical protein